MSSQTPPPPSPPRRRLGTGVLVFVALASSGLGAGAVWLLGSSRAPGQPEESVAPAPRWTCPMHPTVIQDHPGDCPICGMKLVAMEPGAVIAASAAEKHAAAETWTCPMHPNIVQDHPGNCPLCGMKLVKAEPAPEAAADSGAPSGLSTVTIDPARQQLINLKTVPVTRGAIGGRWRTAGRVAVDETRVRHINIKFAGFVEEIFVDFIGKPVRKGQPLFSIYSPEAYAAQEEYLLALRTKTTLAQAEGFAENGAELVRSARRKLELWDMPASEIERLERTGQPKKAVNVYSPISGAVVKKDVVQGMRLEAGAMPYEIVDLSEVWVLADIYETELRHAKLGLPAEFTLKAFPDRTFRGKVAFIDPVLEKQTRTVKVRLNFPNPTGDLRPEMFGEVVLVGTSSEGLRIPTDSVIDSGTRSIVFVAHPGGKFEPREVRLGDSDGELVQVVNGLGEGERVVTRANFLVDSESRLRASLAGLGGSTAGPSSSPSAPPPSAPPKGHEGH